MKRSNDVDVNPYQSPTASSLEGSLENLNLPRTEVAEITPELLADAHFVRFGTASLLIRFFAIVVGCMCVALVVMILIRERMQNYRMWLVTAIIGVPGSMLVLWGFVGKLITRQSLCSWYSVSGKNRYTMELEFGHEALTVTGPRGSARYAWSDLKWKGSGDDVVLAWADSRHPIILPMRTFSAETQEFVCMLRTGP